MFHEEEPEREDNSDQNETPDENKAKHHSEGETPSVDQVPQRKSTREVKRPDRRVSKKLYFLLKKRNGKLQCRRRWTRSIPTMYGISSSHLKIANQLEANGYSNEKSMRMDQLTDTRHSWSLKAFCNKVAVTMMKPSVLSSGLNRYVP